MNWVLDASALVCWLGDELGAARVEEVLGQEEPVLIHAVNLVEVQYHLMRRGERALQIAHDDIQATEIEVVRALDDALLGTAARLKAHHAPIALGDTFAVALAAERSATLLTTDRRELEKISVAGICQVEFLR